MRIRRKKIFPGILIFLLIMFALVLTVIAVRQKQNVDSSAKEQSRPIIDTCYTNRSGGFPKCGGGCASTDFSCKQGLDGSCHCYWTPVSPRKSKPQCIGHGSLCSSKGNSCCKGLTCRPECKVGPGCWLAFYKCLP